MSRSLLAILMFAGLSACAEEPTPRQADQAMKANIAEETADAVKEEKNNIEQAAEAAVKLIEDEARQEIQESARAQDIMENELPADRAAP